jgi:hypothetical protein
MIFFSALADEKSSVVQTKIKKLFIELIFMNLFSAKVRYFLKDKLKYTRS